jgi:RNA polymerase subunit RPABC4/transcription elongation factor Spt4
MTDLLAQALSNPAVSTVGSAIAVALVALWLAAAWWAYSDAARRTESWFAGFLAAAWVVISTPLLLPLALAVYGFARPQVTAAEQRARALVTALGATASSGPACASCRAPVESGWLRCPECSTWLAAPCKGCGEWSDPQLEICPWCGREGHDSPAVETLAPVASVSFPRSRRGRTARRAVGSGAVRQGCRRVAAGADGRGSDGRAAEGRATDGRSADGRPLAPVRGRG